MWSTIIRHRNQRELCSSSRRRHTRCALVTGVQTCALPILPANFTRYPHSESRVFTAEPARGLRVDSLLTLDAETLRAFGTLHRQNAVSGQRVSVLVDFGGRRTIRQIIQ